MNVSDAMSRNVLTCRASDPLERAAQIMWDHDCGAVPVVDAQGGVQGVVTDRDLAMASYTGGQPLNALPVERAMGRAPACCQPEDDLKLALKTMREAGVRRLPVVEESGRLVGMLSLADVLQASGRAEGRAKKQITDPLLETLVELTRPRRAAEPATLVPAAPRKRAAATPGPRSRRSKGKV